MARESMKTEEKNVQKKRRLPFGVWVLVVLQIVNALLLLLYIWASSSAFESDVDDLETGLNTIESAANNLVIDVIYAVVGLVIAFGLFRLRYWAWIALMLWTGSHMAGSLMSYSDGQAPYVAMLRDVVIVFYFNQQEVRQIFMGQRAEPVAEGL